MYLFLFSKYYHLITYLKQIKSIVCLRIDRYTNYYKMTATCLQPAVIYLLMYFVTTAH